MALTPSRSALLMPFVTILPFSDVAATTEYGALIHASVEKDNVFACQFHPEKSSDVGLQILKNFVELS